MTVGFSGFLVTFPGTVYLPVFPEGRPERAGAPLRTGTAFTGQENCHTPSNRERMPSLRKRSSSPNAYNAYFPRFFFLVLVSGISSGICGKVGAFWSLSDLLKKPKLQNWIKLSLILIELNPPKLTWQWKSNNLKMYISPSKNGDVLLPC